MFKKGQRVLFTSSRTGEKCDATVVDAFNTSRGVWFLIKLETGRILKVRMSEIQG